jgi:uncharacterized OB-fold protein
VSDIRKVKMKVEKQWKKPLPYVDQDMEPFWAAAKRHEFRLFQCKVCKTWYFPPAFCREDHNEPFFGNLEWSLASGKGKVFAAVVVHRAFHPGFRDDVPWCYAIMELEEGPLFAANVIDCDPYAVKIGMPVEVVFRDVTEKFTLPYFRLAK